MEKIPEGTNADDWTKAVKSAAESSQKRVCSNGKELRVFSKDQKEETRALGYTKLKFHHVALFSKKILDESEDYLPELDKAVKTMGKHYALIHRQRAGDLFPIPHQLAVDQSHLQPGEALSLEQNEILQASTRMTRSVLGIHGAYFLHTEEGSRIVVKIECAPIRQYIADKIYQEMGFKTPGCVVVHKSSNEGQLIHTKLLDFGKTYFAEKPDKSNFSLLQHQLDKRDYFLTMDFLGGVHLGDISRTRDDLMEDLRDPDFMRQLGEMLFLDRILMNGDRLSPDTCNLGNLMRVHAELPGDKKIALLDHEIKLSPNRLYDWQTDMVALLKGNAVEESLETLTEKLKLNEETYTQLANDMSPYIREGIEAAADKFLDKFSNPDEFLSNIQINLKHVSNNEEIFQKVYTALRAATKLIKQVREV